MKPLVSILIPAFNADPWIAETLQSAIGQTWPHKEIIVVDDGSTDRTGEIARRFASKEVSVISTENQGASAARNLAFRLSRGEYIQWLDADDLLAPDKIERQLAMLRESDSKFLLLSSSWAPFYHRTGQARFVVNSLCQDLAPVEWLLRKMSMNLHMQTATWLVSRELTEAAGAWDTSLSADDDGEYFARTLMFSEGTRFVANTGVFYRAATRHSLRYIGNSERKKASLFRSIKRHVQYLQSLEQSERIRLGCLAYLKIWYPCFFPESEAIVAELQEIAAQLQGRLEPPKLRWKYAWIRPIFGWRAAKSAQRALPDYKAAVARCADRIAYSIGPAKSGGRQSERPINLASRRVEFRVTSQVEFKSPNTDLGWQEQKQIPRRIIQTGKSADLSLKSRALVLNMRLVNPDFDYMFFDDAAVEDFITREFNQYLTLFHSFRFPIQKYDFFRYLAVYRYGGFYFDLDMLLASELSSLLKHSCVFPFEALTVSRFLRNNLGMDWLIGNYAFGATAGHPFLKMIIDNCVRGQREPNWSKPMMRGSPPFLEDEFFVLNSTGPGLVSRTFAENPEFADAVTILLPHNVCDVGNWNHFGEFGIHLMDSSWRSHRNSIRKKIADLWWRRIQRANIERGRRVRAVTLDSELHAETSE